MQTPVEKFQNTTTRWNQEMKMPWATLKYKLVRANLEKHLDQQQMHILDVGGGNGLEAIPFAVQGNTIEIVDYSQEMLGDADKRASQFGVEGSVRTHHAPFQKSKSYFLAITLT